MVRISLKLRGTSFVASGQQRRRDSTERRSGGVEECPSGNNVLRLPDIRNNFFRILKYAAAHTGQRKRSSHQLQKRAAFDRIIPLFGMLRVFAFDKLAKLRRVGQLLETAPR